MMQVSGLITDNVRDARVVDALKSKGIVIKGDEGSFPKQLEAVVNSGKISDKELNAILYQQLFYGTQRYGRLYYLNDCRKIKFTKDWKPFLEKYGRKNMFENRILQTIPNTRQKIKLAAIQSYIEDGDLKIVELLFVYYTKVKEAEHFGSDYIFSYIPVELNLENRTLLMRTRYRMGIVEEDAADSQLNQIEELLQEQLEIAFEYQGEKAMSSLYRMSVDLFDEFIQKIPGYERVRPKQEDIPRLVHELLDGVDFANQRKEDGYKTIDTNVIDVREELFKLLQQVFLLDYLKDEDSMDIIRGMKQYVARIKFSDQSNLDAALVSEKDNKCVFDAKTFMSVRNSIDTVKEVKLLAVTFPKKITAKQYTSMTVKYVVTNMRYMQIHVLNEWYCDESDFAQIMELYNKYEQKNSNKSGKTSGGPAA